MRIKSAVQPPAQCIDLFRNKIIYQLGGIAKGVTCFVIWMVIF